MWYVFEADADAIKRWYLTSPLAAMLRGRMIRRSVMAADRWRAGMQRARWLAPSPGCHAEAAALTDNVWRMQGDGALACDKPAGWRPAPGYVVRPGRLELARLDDLLGDCTDNIVVAKMDVEARALERSFSLVVEAGVRLRALSLLPLCVS